MFRTAILLPLLAGVALAQDDTPKADLWLQDFAAAQAKAKAEKKDLLVDFTGSDWCGWCIRLDNEVFSKQEFQDDAPKKFVLVKLDYPRDKTILTEAIVAQNEKLQETYKIQGFPTILLMDHEGRVYAQAGYQEGGPEPFNKMLAEAHKRGMGFQAAMATAAAKKGVDRAQALDDALTALDEPIAATYHFERMKEIVALDADGKAGLQKKYGDKVRRMQEAEQANEIAMELNELIGELMQANEADKAIAALDGVIKAPKTPLHKQMALYFKGMVTFQGKKDVDAAVALLEEAKKLDPESIIGKQIDEVIPQLKQQGK